MLKLYNVRSKQGVGTIVHVTQIIWRSYRNICRDSLVELLRNCAKPGRCLVVQKGADAEARSSLLVNSV